MHKYNLICWNCRNENAPSAKWCSSCGATLDGPTAFDSQNTIKIQQTDSVMHNNCNEGDGVLGSVVSCPFCGSRNLSRIMKQTEPPTKAPILPKMWHFPTPQPEYKTIRSTKARTEMGCLYWLFVGWWIWGFYIGYWVIKGMCWLFYAMIRLIFLQAFKSVVKEEYYDFASDFYGGDVEVIYKLDPENTEVLREYLSRKYYGSVESMFYQECGQNCIEKGFAAVDVDELNKCFETIKELTEFANMIEMANSIAFK